MANHDLQSRLLTFIKEHQLFNSNDRLLVAVSGGLDSAVLCHLLSNAGFNFNIAHCNFGLRGSESDRDEKFVAGLATTYGVKFQLARFDTAAFAQNNKLSIQEAARKLRYDWFATLVCSPLLTATRKDQGKTTRSVADTEVKTDDYTNTIFNFLLTAHHADDNIETAAMNFFKGTGIAGLRGMLPKTGTVVRPLLFARRTELEAYAEGNGLKWVEDSSNQESKYTRNFFRWKVLPLVEEKVPGALENLAQNLARFSEIETLYQQAVDGYRKSLVEWNGAEMRLPVLKLLQVDPLPTVLHELLKPFGFSAAQTAEVQRLLRSESGRFVRSRAYQAIRHRRWLVIAPLQPEQQGHVVVDAGETLADYGNGQLRISEERLPESVLTEPSTALLDGKTIQFPLVLRRWKTGDYFYPLGMRKKKKIGRFLADLKLSRSEKERIWVVESGQRIVWVVGYRIDDRCKITTATKKIIRITSSPATEAKAEHPG